MHKARSEVLIKKYSNRRLYDTRESRYITLEELADMIRKGEVVRVLDAKTHEDLTQQTLTQLILESGRANRLLPTPLLHQLIRMDDDDLAEFFGKYVSWALEMYQAARSGAQAIAPFNPLATLPFAATSAMARFFSQPPSWQAPPPPPAPPEGEARGEAIADLRRELDELKAALGKK
jgi:polyhydroxyalkanoate synthesis repressor PhaR